VNRASAGSAGASVAVELRVLGGLELSMPSAAAAADLLARHKPLALLFFLVLGDPAGARRDTLLEQFWPESDAERARSSLRQAVYQLRRVLGAGVVVGRGELLCVPPGALRCDAVEFERALARGDAAGALAAYRGDLVPGFHVDGAPGFERWLEERRVGLHQAAVAAAQALADAAQRADDLPAALQWSGRAVELAPEAEPAVRRLLALLDRSGDRVGAVRAYEAFARRLRDVAGVEPAPDTAALVAVMRGDAAPVVVAALDPRRVLVTAFDAATAHEALASFAGLVADVVARGVARLEGLEVVPPAAAPAAAEGDADRLSGLARARLAAVQVAAATVVTGTCALAEGQLVVQGWIADVGDARETRVLTALGPVRAPVDRPLVAAEALAAEAQASLARLLEPRVVHVRAAARAPSYEAHRAYVEGMGRFVDGDWRDALQHFARSATHDASYALPPIVSAIAHWNLAELPAAEDAVQRALPLAAHAGPFERATLDMVRAWLGGDWAAAYEAVRRQTELAPGSIAAVQLAEEARRRNRPREALRLLAALDPARGELRGWVFYWVVTAQALHMVGEHVRELEVARRARALHPESTHALRLEVHARAALGDVPGVLACLDESLATTARAEPRPGTLMREAALELRAHGHAPDDADALLAQSLAWLEELPDEERVQPAVRRATARALHDVGAWDRAAEAFTALAGDTVAVADCGAVHHPHLQAHLDHGHLGVLALRRSDGAEAARLDALLASARGPQRFGSTHYWRAAMAAWRGERDAAVRLLRRAFADGLPYEPFVHADPQLAPLRGTPEFDALLAPRG
jgi:DNA-binding SARP family transcriptional activator